MTTDPATAPDAHWWAAPFAPGMVDASVQVPGSKSLTNRALVLAALSDGPSTITNALRSRDTELMIGALRTLGVEVAILESGDESDRLTPASGMTLQMVPHYLGSSGAMSIDVGLAGTVMRFLPPVAGLAQGEVLFNGDRAAWRRPMATLIEAMRDVGIEVDDAGTGKLPFVVSGRGEVPGGEVVLDASRSSQFVTAMLMSAARFDAGATIHHVGHPIPSTPHIDMTVRMLAQHGVQVRETADPPINGHSRFTWHVDPQQMRAHDWHIEPDISNALPFIAAAIVTGGRMRILDWPTTPLQPTEQIVDVLQRFGADVTQESGALVVKGPPPSTGINGIDVDLSTIGETAPTMTAIAAFANDRCTLRGIGHIRGHETDRLAALEAEINGLGGAVTQTEDGLRIDPAPLQSGRFRTYEDHRMATTAAIIGSRVDGIEVENIATTAKTMPDFPRLWASILT